MTDVTSSKSTRRPHHWRHDLIELAALFTAVVVADTIAKSIVKGPDGPYLLVFSAIVSATTTAVNRAASSIRSCRQWCGRRVLFEDVTSVMTSL